MQIQSILQNKLYLFWFLQVVGWSGWGTSHLVGVISYGKAPANFVYYMLIITPIGLIISLGLRSLYHYMWEMAAIRRIPAILAACYAAFISASPLV